MVCGLTNETRIDQIGDDELEHLSSEIGKNLQHLEHLSLDFKKYFDARSQSSLMKCVGVWRSQTLVYRCLMLNFVQT